MDSYNSNTCKLIFKLLFKSLKNFFNCDKTPMPLF